MRVRFGLYLIRLGFRLIGDEVRTEVVRLLWIACRNDII